MVVVERTRVELHPAQLSALSHVRDHARSRADRARETLREIRTMANLPEAAFEHGIAGIAENARVVLHFHPDRLDAEFRTVAEGLLQTGHYKSQFETGISNGSVSAHRGGLRDRLEEKLFGGVYQAEDVAPADRPKYGALDLLRHADGPSPRFGSCYLVLSREISERTTFTYQDSHQDPRVKGTVDEMDDLVAAVFSDVFYRDSALGERSFSPRGLLERLEELPAPYGDPSARLPARNLNEYVEAQVHGPVRLLEDVDVLVADPSFRDVDVGQTLNRVCERHGIALRWHGGFALASSEVPADFRGPTMPSLAERVAVDGVVDAAAIGRAAADLVRAPGGWADRGDHSAVLQELKLLWHVLVRFGRARG